MSGWTILYCVFLLVIFLISLGLITQASTKIGASNADPNLQNAYKITTIIAVVLWIAIAAVIFGGVSLFLVGGEAIEAESVVAQYQNNGSIWSTLFFILLMILLIIVGVGAAAAAVDISKFTGYNNNADLVKAFDDCCYAAGLCLGTLFIIFGIFIISYFYTSDPTPVTNTIPVTKNTNNGVGAANVKTIIAQEVVKELAK